MPQRGQRDTGKTVAPVGTEELYGLPLEQFVNERNELARRLRREGRSQDAERVAKLPKPALAAWGANQALRSQPAAARELRAAGEALTDAQSAALSGRANPGELRAASRRHRVALDRLVDAARGLLDSKGHALSRATVERVAQTLNAASLDPSLAEQGEQGRLEREHFYTGLDELAPTAETKPARPKRARAMPKRSATSRTATARERRERERERKLRAEQIKAARKRLSEARKQTATASKMRDAAARAAKTAAAEHRRAQERHAKALEAQTNAQAELDAARREGR